MNARPLREAPAIHDAVARNRAVAGHVERFAGCRAVFDTNSFRTR